MCRNLADTGAAVALPLTIPFADFIHTHALFLHRGHIVIDVTPGLSLIPSPVH